MAHPKHLLLGYIDCDVDILQILYIYFIDINLGSKINNFTYAGFHNKCHKKIKG